MLHSKRFIIIGILLILIVVGFLLAQPFDNAPPTLYFPETNCHIDEKACQAALPDGKMVALTLSPASLPMLTTLSIVVELTQLRASQITVAFEGINMNMGENVPILKAEHPFRFTGNTVLPVCYAPTMQWRARVLIKTDEGDFEAPFLFETKKMTPAADQASL